MKKFLRYCGLAAMLVGAALYFSNCDDEERRPYGGPWKIVRTPPEVEATVSEIQFLNKEDGWAIAGKYLLRLKGKEWVAHKKIVHPDPLRDYGFADFYLFNDKDGWFVGSEIVPQSGGSPTRNSMIWRYDGETFTAVKHPDKGWLGTVWFNNANDGWAFGYGAINYKNGEWEEVELKAIVDDCFFFNENDGWAVSRGYIWRWDGVNWVRVAECGTFEEFASIAFNERDQGWAGLYGTWTGEPHMFYYDGYKWDYYQGKFKQDILAIDFSSPDYGCAAGNEVFIFEDGEWLPTADPKATFWCVECVGPNDIWAGSDTGDIYHFTGFN